MQSSDRRAAPRFRISIPLHFQLTKSPDLECLAETLDISARGMCMETDAPPGVGAILIVRLRMPEMIMGWRAPEWCITCQVIHVELSTEPGKFDVGVQFHYYEATAPPREHLLAKLEAAVTPLGVRI